MTTILACLTPAYVALASDRGVSYGSPTDPPPDRMTKTVLLYGQFLMGFTGLAELDGMPIDEWVIERLGDCEVQQWPRALANSATEAVARIRRSSARKHHAFIAVGFAPNGPSIPKSDWRPIRFVISNAYDAAGNWLERAATMFTTAVLRHPSRRWADLHSFGGTLEPGLLRWSERTLRRYDDHHRGAPQLCVDMLSRLVAGASTKYPTTVSSASMVSVLPKEAAGTGNVDVPLGTAAHVSNDAITCFNFVGLDDQVIAYMPAIVTPGGSAIVKGGFFGPVGVEPPSPFENRPDR